MWQELLLGREGFLDHSSFRKAAGQDAQLYGGTPASTRCVGLVQSSVARKTANLCFPSSAETGFFPFSSACSISSWGSSPRN